MKTQIHEYITITAEDGYFLTNHNGLYGTEIVLGSNDSPENYEELPLSKWPEIENTQQVEESTQEEPTQEDKLLKAKAIKISSIERYDVSYKVNGFYYNGKFMWLDRETRATLRNTIESLELVGRNELNIWYKYTYITLDLDSAKRLLALLEVYATDCYNVTERHKKEIIEMEDIDEVISFDIREGYPEMLNL